MVLQGRRLDQLVARPPTDPEIVGSNHRGGCIQMFHLSATTKFKFSIVDGWSRQAIYVSYGLGYSVNDSNQCVRSAYALIQCLRRQTSKLDQLVTIQHVAINTHGCSAISHSFEVEQLSDASHNTGQQDVLRHGSEGVIQGALIYSFLMSIV